MFLPLPVRSGTDTRAHLHSRLSFHRITEWLRLEGTSDGLQSMSPIKAGPVLGQSFVSLCFDHLQGSWRLHLLSAPIPVLVLRILFLIPNWNISLCNLWPFLLLSWCPSRCTALCAKKRGIISLDLLVKLLLMQPGVVGPHCFRDTPLSPAQLVLHQDAQSFFC